MRRRLGSRCRSIFVLADGIDQAVELLPVVDVLPGFVILSEGPDVNPVASVFPNRSQYGGLALNRRVNKGSISFRCANLRRIPLTAS